MDQNNPGVSGSEDPQDKADNSADSNVAEDEEPPKLRPEDPVTMQQKLKLFFGTHLEGVVAFLTPIIFLFVLAPFPPEKWQWCAYTLCIMAVYWVFECIPLPITSFLPVIVFPLTDIMDTRTVCMQYMNNTVVMFLGSIMLAASVEQSGLHKRIALYAIKLIGYSHYKMLFAVSFVTMFISMWITNTAAATLMVPIVFALLRVYEGQKLYVIFEKNKSGDIQATPLTSCYFCCITFASTIGGIGTLVGTATNLTFIGLFISTYPTAPEYVSFPLFSAFTIPGMILMNLAMYFYLAVYYMGMLRASSAAAKKVRIPKEGQQYAKKAVEDDIKKLGKISWHEIMVIILFGGAMLMFFSRSPQIFPGWADRIKKALKLKDKFILDSATATLIIFLMTLGPATLKFFQNFKAKYVEELPKGPVPPVLDWDLMNKTLPYSFCFLLAGGFALSTAAKPQYADLNGKIGIVLAKLEGLPHAFVLMVVIVFTTFVTNFASNVAVCNVIAPIAMQLGLKLSINPLWYCIAAGLSASYCFMLPVGTPGNLIVQSAAKIPISEMMIAGAGPTVTTILLTWFICSFYAPIIWPILHEIPAWAIPENATTKS